MAAYICRKFQKMNNNLLFAFALTLLAIAALQGCSNTAPKTPADLVSEQPDTLRYAQEIHLKNLRQLTFGGDNAEAYFSFSGQELVFQVTNKNWGLECDQIFYMPITGYTGEKPPMASTGKGRTTCAYFMPGDESMLYASTHLADENCPPPPVPIQGKYVWPIYNTFNIFVADRQGNIIKQLTDSPSYDAEATVSPDGQKIVFTSTRSGDLDLWVMNIDGSNPQQITHEIGYDGGAFFSPDSKKIVFRASRFETPEEKEEYKQLLMQGMVQPTNMEIFVCNADGSELQQVTKLGKANWAPFFHPSGKRILFTSNHHSPSGRKFNIFSIKLNGSDLQQITFDEAFDAFPMFSPDGKKIVFSSNRFNGGGRDTNVFVADWVE
jgi:TolB protein